MMQTIRSEFRKLLSIRTTYGFLAFYLIVLTFFAFYIDGLRQTHVVNDIGKLASEITSAATFLGVFLSFPGILLVTHEYRYNTILYSLTATNNRLKVLFAKVIVVTIWSVVVGTVICLLSPLLAKLGMSLHHVHLVPQSIPYADLLPRSIFYIWAYSMLALIIAFLIRSQPATVAAMLVVPGIIETLLSLVLKQKAMYLPFTAISQVIQDRSTNPTMASADHLTHEGAIIVTLLYIVGGFIISAILFERRDAN